MNNLTKTTYADAHFGELAIAIELQTLWQLGNAMSKPAFRRGVEEGFIWGIVAGLSISVAIVLFTGG